MYETLALCNLLKNGQKIVKESACWCGAANECKFLQAKLQETGASFKKQHVAYRSYLFRAMSSCEQGTTNLSAPHAHSLSNTTLDNCRRSFQTKIGGMPLAHCHEVARLQALQRPHLSGQKRCFHTLK